MTGFISGTGMRLRAIGLALGCLAVGFLLSCSSYKDWDGPNARAADEGRTVEETVSCPRCCGTENEPSIYDRKCTMCGGSGVVKKSR